MIRPRSILALLLVLAGLGGTLGAGFSIARSNAAQEVGPLAAAADEAPNEHRIGALGTVEPPGGTIGITPSVSGVVARVFVSPGDEVAAGTVIFVLDGRIARAKVNQLQGALTSAEARLEEARGTLPALRAAVDFARATVAAAEAQRDEAADDLATAEQLVGTGSTISRRDVERRRNLLRSAVADVEASRARLMQAEAEVEQLDDTKSGSRLRPLIAAVGEARAALTTAEMELQQLSVRSPVDARVLEVNIRGGEFAAASPEGSPAIVLAPLGLPQVRAEIEEADLPRLVDGAQAWGLVRGGDGTRIPMEFVRREPLLRAKRTLAGDSSERIDTRVIEVVYRATEPASLVPGQLVDVLIDTRQSPRP